MASHDIIVVGASAGGVEALSQMAEKLPPGLPASLFVVCHFPPGETSILPELLSRAGPLLATHARDGEPYHPGHIYIAPPDYHLLLQNGRMQVAHGARENGHRPAIDPLFRTAARVHGRRVIGVVLTGALSDGVAGLMAVRAEGGIGVVQDPADARVASLPQNAWSIAGADYVVPLARIAPLLSELVRRPVSEGGPVAMDPLENMPQRVDATVEEQVQGDRRGEVSMFTCPECGGALWQVDQKNLVRFRCHVGHAYNGEHLLAQQAEASRSSFMDSGAHFPRTRGLVAPAGQPGKGARQP